MLPLSLFCDSNFSFSLSQSLSSLQWVALWVNLSLHPFPIPTPIPTPPHPQLCLLCPPLPPSYPSSLLPGLRTTNLWESAASASVWATGASHFPGLSKADPQERPRGRGNRKKGALLHFWSPFLPFILEGAGEKKNNEEFKTSSFVLPQMQLMMAEELGLTF